MKRIDESFENLIGFDKKTIEKKKQYAQDVYAILQQSYQKIGGVKGSGFSSIQDMIDNIYFWKLYKQNGKVAAVLM